MSPQPLNLIDRPQVHAGDRRVRRFYHRALTGIAVGGNFRLITLTTSDEALAAGKDIHQSWRKLLMRLRRLLGVVEYVGVVEAQPQRTHLHLCVRSDFIPQRLLSKLWQEVHLSPIVDIRSIKRLDMVRYLAKYLSKAFTRYWCSYGWVFRAWVGWGRFVKAYSGSYPSRGIITTIARMRTLREQARAILNITPIWGLTNWPGCLRL